MIKYQKKKLTLNFSAEQTPNCKAEVETKITVKFDMHLMGFFFDEVKVLGLPTVW
jgi:hypothetical protein